MKYLITKWFGVFLCDKKGVYKKTIFPKDANKICRNLEKIDQNKILSKEKEIVNDKKVIVNEKRLRSLGKYNPSDPFFKEMKIKPEDYGFELGLLSKASTILASKKIDKKLEADDVQIIQMIDSLDDLIHISNLLYERINTWEAISLNDKIKPVKNSFDKINEEIKILETQINEDMVVLAPNIYQVIGPIIGARLISLAGGLKDLASLPASTIQVLGAEKALFRFKKEGGKPPKHGVIFQHPMLNRAPRKIRGKIARVMGSKISIAAKADAFTGNYIAEELTDDLEKRIKEIKNL